MKGEIKMNFLKFIKLSTIFNIWDHLHLIKPIQDLDIEGSWYFNNMDIVNTRGAS
ncbi:hypothetical protein HMPREF3209_01489 [Lactobacillus crispatus]|nr:hypothetical protein HMPREF3209_01489 [Lactobacillus crispatus]